MAYTGSIDLIAGLRPKNNANFPLVNAPHVLVDETNDKRLSTRLDELQNGIDAKYTKPATGIPASDLASDVVKKAELESATEAMTQVVGIDNYGRLRTAPTGGGGTGGVTDYGDLTGKPTINSVTLSGNKTSADLGLAAASDLSGKADKVANPTNGNFAALDSNGNLTDSGHKHADYVQKSVLEEKTSAMTQAVGIGTDGKLYTAPGSGGGGTGGVTDYGDLTGKPSINSVTLSGNKTASDLGLAAASDIPTVWDGSYIGGVNPTVTTVTTFQVTLAASSWSNGAQTVNNALFAATGYAYWVSPSGSSRDAYKTAGVYSDDVTADGSLVFHCDTTPESALTVNIMRTVSG